MSGLGVGRIQAGNFPLRVLIVIDVRLFRDGLTLILDAHDIEVVACVDDWRVALPLVARHRPDVVLVDRRAAANRAVIRQLAGADQPPARVVVLSIDACEDDLLYWAEAGVAGYLTREDSLEDLIEVIKSVAQDEMPCSPRAAATLLRRVGTLAADRQVTPARLTTREREIVSLMERGLSNKEIGRSLAIQVATVKNHVHNILEKLQVASRFDAVALVQGRGALRTFAGVDRKPESLARSELGMVSAGYHDVGGAG